MSSGLPHAWDYRADGSVACPYCGLDYNNLEEGQEENCRAQ